MLHEGMTFHSDMIQWPVVPGDRLGMCIAAVRDTAWKVREPFRSHEAKLTFLASPDTPTPDSAHVYLISLSCTLLDYVVNASIEADTYQLQNVRESADHIRAAIVHMHNLLDEELGM